METKTVEKILDIAGSTTKLAANLSEQKPKEASKPQPYHQTDDNSNKATTGTQSVVISMDSKKKDPKPIEKHIHEFPENRPLTSEECELALKKAQMDYELQKSEQQYLIKRDERAWQHQMEVEKKNERKGKVRRIIGGILVALGAGAVGYSIYTDYRDHKNQPVVPRPLPEGAPVKVDGEVK